MKKVTLHNPAHNTSVTFLTNCATAQIGFDLLVYRAYGDNDSWAQAKVRRIRKTLCGMKGCSCRFGSQLSR